MKGKCVLAVGIIIILQEAWGFLVNDDSLPIRLCCRSKNSNTRLRYLDDKVVSSESLSLDYIPLLNAADLCIRQQYEAWRYKYGKVSDESRYLIFKRHFLEQQFWNARNGENHELNEYGDMSESEYLQLLQGFVVKPKMTQEHTNLLHPPLQGLYLHDTAGLQDSQCLLTRTVDNKKDRSRELMFLECHVDNVKKLGWQSLQSLKRWCLEATQE